MRDEHLSSQSQGEGERSRDSVALDKGQGKWIIMDSKEYRYNLLCREFHCLSSIKQCDIYLPSQSYSCLLLYLSRYLIINSIEHSYNGFYTTQSIYSPFPSTFCWTYRRCIPHVSYLSHTKVRLECSISGPGWNSIIRCNVSTHSVWDYASWSLEYRETCQAGETVKVIYLQRHGHGMCASRFWNLMVNS